MIKIQQLRSRWTFILIPIVLIGGCMAGRNMMSTEANSSPETSAMTSDTPIRETSADPSDPCQSTAAVNNSGTWISGKPMKGARSEFAATALDDQIYVAGGLTIRPLNSFEIYDVSQDQWTRSTDLPTSAHHMGMAATDGFVYMTGGYTNMGLTAMTDTAWRFDTATEEWAALAPLPNPRAEHALVVWEDKLYAVGGVGTDADTVLIYDIDAEQWHSSSTSMPTPRKHLAAAAVGGQVYAIGGRRADNSNLATLEIYDIEGDTWRSGAEMPTGRSGIAAAVLNDRIHVVGGENVFDTPRCTYGQHEVFDPQHGTWTAMPHMPNSRHGLAAVALGNRLFVMGGGTRPGILTMVSYSAMVEVFTFE